MQATGKTGRVSARMIAHATTVLPTAVSVPVTNTPVAGPRVICAVRSHSTGMSYFAGDERRPRALSGAPQALAYTTSKLAGRPASRAE